MEFGDHLRSRQLKRACSTHSSTLESSVPVLTPLFPLSLLAHFHRGKWVPKGSPEDWEAQNQKVTPDKVLMFHHNMATVKGQGGAQGRVWGGKRGDLESRKWPILVRNSQVSSARHEFLLKTLPFTTATTETKSQCEFEPPALMWKPAWWHASAGPVLCGCGQDNWDLLIASWALGTVRPCLEGEGGEWWIRWRKDIWCPPDFHGCTWSSRGYFLLHVSQLEHLSLTSSSSHQSGYLSIWLFIGVLCWSLCQLFTCLC